MDSFTIIKDIHIVKDLGPASEAEFFGALGFKKKVPRGIHFIEVDPESDGRLRQSVRFQRINNPTIKKDIYMIITAPSLLIPSGYWNLKIEHFVDNTGRHMSNLVFPEELLFKIKTQTKPIVC